MKALVVLGWWLVVLVAPLGAGAQECEACGSGLLFEADVGRVLGGIDSTREHWMGVVRVGRFAPLGERSDWGGAVFLGATDIGPWAGVEGRYRRFLSSRASLDLGLGLVPLVEGTGSAFVVGSAGLNANRSVGLRLQLQTLQDPYVPEASRSVVPSMALRLAGKPAGVVVGVLGGLWLVAMVIVEASGGPMG